MPSETGQTGHEDEGAEQFALAVFTQMLLLAGALMAGHALTRRHVSWIGEAGVALLLGAGIGMLIWSAPWVSVHSTFAQMLGFSKPFFFLAILPPIIFESGWSMDVERFFNNCGAIGCIAVFGTLISTFVIALLVWAAGAAGLCAALPFLQALLFGSVISATDPVTVLSVFQRLGADPDLFAMVLGESLLNDAVAMVLFRSLSTFLHVPVTAGAVLLAAAGFVGVFVGSMAVGAGVAFAAAAIVRTGYFRSEHGPLESSLVILFAWASYLLADGLRLSGIVSVLFCGLVSAHYVRPNMTARGQDRVGSTFKLLATLAETSVFIFVGASLFLGQHQEMQPGARTLLPFLLVCFVAMAVSRAANVWPCVAAVNYLRLPQDRIPQSHRFMLWWAGLRGAMAFAIAMEAADALPVDQGGLILSSTYFIIVVTVLINGGACTYWLERLGLKQQPEQKSLLLPKPGQVELCSASSPPGGADIPAAHSPGMLDHTWQDVTVGSTGTLLPLHAPIAPGKPSGNPLARGVQKLRVANSSGGVLSKLDKLDKRWLGPLFLAPGAAPQHARHAAGDIDADDGHVCTPRATTHAGLGTGSSGVGGAEPLARSSDDMHRP